MHKSFVWAVAALFVGALVNCASAQYIYSPYSSGYYPAPLAVPVATTYAAPSPVGYDSVYVTPVAYSVPVTRVYAAPVVVARPFYVAAPVIHVVPTTIVRESLTVRPFSSVYVSQSHGYGTGHRHYERSTPFRTVIRGRGW